MRFLAILALVALITGGCAGYKSAESAEEYAASTPSHQAP